jgi:5-methyltetrahydrofolate--homocysteine methyltransferase
MTNLINDLECGRILLFDGARGTALNKKGLTFGEETNLAHVNHPTIVTDLAKEYIEAGSDILTTNTFQASSISLERYNRSEEVYEINYKAARLLKDIPNVKYVAGSLGPTTGEFKEWATDPKKAYSEDEFYEAYKQQIQALKDAGIDLIICETFLIYQELRAALRASKESGMITSVSLAFDYREKKEEFTTIYGANIDNLTSLNAADIIGFNCGSITLDQAVELTRRLRERTDKPLLAEPNGGIPAKQEQDYPPEVFAEYGDKIIEAGVQLIGGCCRTTSDHIRELRKIVDRHNV